MRAVFAALLLASAFNAPAQLSPDTEAKVAAATEKVLADTGVPSAAVGLVQNGRIVYAHAFGLARLAPSSPASASMAYPIGSISKQFTAAAVLLLQQDGKLSLNDPVAKFYPELTQAGDVTLRHLLSHTSGYQDYAPQDYTIPAWKVPTDPLKVVHEFAGKPLDFQPGTEWQYSNTNFVLAALIVQKVSGQPFADFLRDRILRPAHLEGVLNLNTQGGELQVTGYMRNALAPLRPASLEASGWYFGDGDLAMPVASLLTWDLSMLNQSLLSPASYREMETAVALKSGKSTGYGLGVSVRTFNGARAIEHSGEVGGFVAENIVLPDERVAIAVLTNQEASRAASSIARALLPLMLPRSSSPADATATAFIPQLKSILSGLQAGKVDRSLLTTDAISYFDRDAVSDFATSLAPLGQITAIALTSSSLRGGMTFGVFKVSFSAGKSVDVTVYLQPDRKVEQLLVVGQSS